MLGNGVEMSLIFCGVLGPLVLGWAPSHFVLGAQLAHGEKRLVCIPAKGWDFGALRVPRGSNIFFVQTWSRGISNPRG